MLCQLSYPGMYQCNVSDFGPPGRRPCDSVLALRTSFGTTAADVVYPDKYVRIHNIRVGNGASAPDEKKGLVIEPSWCTVEQIIADFDAFFEHGAGKLLAFPKTS